MRARVRVRVRVRVSVRVRVRVRVSREELPGEARVVAGEGGASAYQAVGRLGC